MDHPKKILDAASRIILQKAANTKDLRSIRPALLKIAALAEVQIRANTANGVQTGKQDILINLKSLRCSLDMAIEMAENMPEVLMDPHNCILMEDSITDAAMQSFMAYQAWDDLINGNNSPQGPTPLKRA